MALSIREHWECCKGLLGWTTAPAENSPEAASRHRKGEKKMASISPAVTAANRYLASRCIQ
jgi:hypothetical protein